MKIFLKGMLAHWLAIGTTTCLNTATDSSYLLNYFHVGTGLGRIILFSICRQDPMITELPISKRNRIVQAGWRPTESQAKAWKLILIPAGIHRVAER